MDVGEEEFVALREQGGVELCAADEVNDRAEVGGGEGWEFVDGAEDGDVIAWWHGLAEHDVVSSGKRFAEAIDDGVEGVASHENWVAEGDFFEELEVFRQVPGQVAIESDDTVGGHGGDGDELGLRHGAMEQRICGGAKNLRWGESLCVFVILWWRGVIRVLTLG